MNLREFAKKLNAIEVLHINSQLPIKYSNKQTQPFRYLLVLDFEATCWDSSDPNKGLSEIIEFPVILYDIERNEILEEFQQYVMPTERPKLSDFCKQLTGIQQTQIDNGVRLKTCLMLFQKWLDEKLTKYNMVFPSNEYSTKNKCVFVTWTDWDLGNCLANECNKKGIAKSTIFSQRIDLLAVYKRYYLRRPKGLRGALLELGLKFEGNEHCGLHDARNTAKLAGRMITDGIVLKVNKS